MAVGAVSLLVAPDLPWTPESNSQPRALHLEVLIACRSGQAEAFELATRNERCRDQLRALAAAVLRDIRAVSDDDAEAWAGLGAWPWVGTLLWFGLPFGSALPPKWWENEGAAGALHRWLQLGDD